MASRARCTSWDGSVTGALAREWIGAAEPCVNWPSVWSASWDCTCAARVSRGCEVMRGLGWEFGSGGVTEDCGGGANSGGEDCAGAVSTGGGGM